MIGGYSRAWSCLPLLAALGVAACAPAKKPPPVEAKVFAPAAWRATDQADGVVSATWWQAFNDPQLSALVEQALQHNTDVLTAISRVEEARQQIQLSRSALFPTVDLSVGGQTTRELGVTGITHTRSVQPELQVSYEADLWGRLRTLEQAARLQYQATQADRDNVRLSIASTTAQAYITLLSLDTQLQVTRDTEKSRLGALAVAKDRAESGYTSQLELTQAQSEYESAAQMVPQTEQAIRQQENALALLTGQLPGYIARDHGLETLKPPVVPGSLPSTLLRRRPDIQQAEHLVAASDLNLEARRDDYLPQVQLSAGIGRLYVNALNYDPIKVWDLGLSVLAPIFTGGQLEAQVNVATAERDQAAYAYRATVLNAFSEVETALSGVTRLEQQIVWVRARINTLRRSLEIATDRYQGGYSSYLEELDAQRNLFDSELAAIQVRETQLNNIVALYQALGGGWAPTP
ncbi:efflux transporter outer membrane subunit [Pseudomonas typographi]|uniref:Efflux transporter outer membrane subunit n=1 Tax=Pseudomonas typographi TaxID=2715964 RepID=A0ABR7YWI6_9PSED|nr:efflux transporter outer membrane subunit [Pseudomonas typographi]MBD1552440.1 efflux transporter outer membrane subunit [Pseudomonas typographi]MBD1585530.1 efflux transporter outer membrane subunit [Pseudomonas typographi]MBD1597555.1 efflux transporter outer membrane subunit [Pseudomonas typographi]